MEVTEDEINLAALELAKDGIFVEPTWQWWELP